MNDQLEQFITFLRQQAEEVGEEVVDAADDVLEYTAERAQHLSTIVGDPGFGLAVRAERDNVLLRSGIRAADQGDAVDARIQGIVEGTLAFAASILSVAL